MEREGTLGAKREGTEQEEPKRLISSGERQALRWIALGIVLFFVTFIVGFVVANS